MNLKKITDSFESVNDISEEDDSPIVNQEIPKGYVDLGLPSGTLWRAHEEDGLYTFEEAVEKFGNSLPTMEQFQELLDNCDYEWDSEHKGCYFTSKINGNYIFLSAAGYRYGSDVYDVGSYGYYWSSSAYYYGRANYLYFGSDYAGVLNYSRDRGQSVRLVK